MSNKLANRKSNGLASPRQLFRQDKVMSKFQELIGNKAQGFVTSVLQAINDNNMLKNADPSSVYGAAMTAAVLDLPINPNLGFAYIIPYKTRGEVKAQFQMGYKGFIQLAQRSGLYKTISATKVYDGQIAKADPLKGYEFDWEAKKSDTVIGYVSYFELLNGFSKPYYMSKKEIDDHAQAYSQSYRKGYGPWKDNFEGMALKTVLKLLITKYGPMTIDMQQAATFDQGVINDVDQQDVDYIDNGLEVDGSDTGEQITDSITGNNDEISDDDADEETGEVYKPKKKDREKALDMAQFLAKKEQNKFVKFVNKVDFTESEWNEWMEKLRAAKKKDDKKKAKSK